MLYSKGLNPRQREYEFELDPGDAFEFEFDDEDSMEFDGEYFDSEFEDDEFEDDEFEVLPSGGISVSSCSSISTATVKRRISDARNAVRAAIKALERVASTNKATERRRWEANRDCVEWFGAYNRNGVKRILRRFGRIMSKMNSGRLKVRCKAMKRNAGRANPLTNTVFLSSINWPSSKAEQIALIVHEVGHVAAAGIDHAEYPSKARSLARRRPALARANLDSLAYFATEADGTPV